MLHLGPISPADVATGQILNLAATTGIAAGQMIRAVQDTLDVWHGQRDGRQHAMQLQILLAEELAGAIERAGVLWVAERQQAQIVVDALRVVFLALDDRLAVW